MANPNPMSSDATLLSNLAQVATEDATELFRSELALAKDELRRDVKQAGTAAIGLIVGVMLLDLSLGLLALGILLAFRASTTAAFLLCLVYAAAGVGAIFYALTHVPQPLSVTKRRVERNIREIVEATK